jgi:hypothetical protein
MPPARGGRVARAAGRREPMAHDALRDAQQPRQRVVLLRPVAPCCTERHEEGLGDGVGHVIRRGASTQRVARDARLVAPEELGVGIGISNRRGEEQVGIITPHHAYMPTTRANMSRTGGSGSVPHRGEEALECEGEAGQQRRCE